MTQHTHSSLTLITGGTGKTGHRIAEQLAARDVPIRIGSRSADPPFDWEDRSTWAPALQGVTAAYLSYFPDLAIPGAADTVGAFARIAVEHGVRRLVLLSGRGEEEAQRAEREVQAAFGDCTILRSTWFNQNFSEGYMLDGILAGVLALPVDTMPEPFVDAGDIAEIAVAALTGDGHAGRLYELTGPRLLSFADAVQEIGRASGRELRFRPVAMDEFAAELERDDVPADVIWLLRYLFTEVLDGRNARLADGVERALGRPPKDFADYARETARTGVWNPA